MVGPRESDELALDRSPPAGCSPMLDDGDLEPRSRARCGRAGTSAPRSSSTRTIRVIRCTSSWMARSRSRVSAEDGTEPTILATIGPGGFFGELALLDGAPRSATASRPRAGRDPRPRPGCVRPARRRATGPPPCAAGQPRRARSGGSPRRWRTSISWTCRAGSPATSSDSLRRAGRTSGRHRCPRARSACPGRTRRASWPG